ncbi:M16 family metallopeptidase [Rhodococcoides kroppenstedtii]|uniref:M16 family metallopeptidase n=1 Tax=Rhodococcoides kroppenstedtii TaxID=293050 RepID=UPI001BDE50C1|nr:insulinase family protein [Rhodococcus kroppenstedtii]MBT1192988.1 insulinase family protein [Rhodococcus kroppenstedtii]
MTVLRSPDGVRVVLLDRPGSGAVTTVAVAPAGWQHDPWGGQGTAHLCEHLATVGSRAADRRVEAIGGTTSATTHVDRQEFRTTAPASCWRTVLADDLDRLRGRIVFDGREFDRQRDAVIDEVRALAASPSPWPALSAAVTDHPIHARDGFGAVADLERLTPDDARAFLARTFRPHESTLALAVDVEAVGGMRAVAAVIERGDPETRDTTGPIVPIDPLPYRPRTVAGPGVTDVWRARTIPGIRADPHSHLEWVAAASVFAPRDVRVGRAGPVAVADTEILAVRGEGRPAEVTETDPGRARRALLGLADRLRHDPVLVARAHALADGSALSTTARTLARTLTPRDLRNRLTELYDTLDAAVVPDPAAAPSGTARPSSRQAPLPPTPRAADRRLHAVPDWRPRPVSTTVGPVPVVPAVPAVPAAPAGAVGSTPAVAVRTPAPTRLSVRLADTSGVVVTPPGWHPVADTGGGRFRAAPLTRDEAVAALRSLPRAGVETLCAVGRDAEVVTVVSSPSTPTAPFPPAPPAPFPPAPTAPFPPGPPASSLADAAADWVALGALNAVARLGAGLPPVVRVIRVPGRRGSVAALVSPDEIAAAAAAVTGEDLAATRAFCSGQARCATGDPDTHVDLLTTLTALGVPAVSGPTDPVLAFADAVDAVPDDAVRGALATLVDTARLTNVMSETG